MPAKRKWTKEQLASIMEDFHSDMTGAEIGSKYGCDWYRSIRPLWLKEFGKQALHDRFRKSCSRSRVGSLNPMHNRTGSSHPLHKESYITSLGYVMVNVPDWWEGSTKASKYLEHVIVGCEKYGLTKPIKGMIFHHIDEDKTNNHPDNIVMMSIAEHMALHKNASRKV